MEAGKRFSALLRACTPLRTWPHHTHSFSVSLLLEELANVPCLTGWIYCKVRLLDGSFTQESERREVILNSVHWGKVLEFECRAVVNRSTGQVGYVDLNLSGFAGSGYVTRHCLLEGYRKNTKLDNSILKIGIRMHLSQGDPCFRVPLQQSPPSVLGLQSEESSEATLRTNISGVSVDSLERWLEIEDRRLDAPCGPSPEAQERAQVAEHLTRVSHTRVAAQDVVDSLCLEGFGSATDLSHTPEDAGLALYVRRDGTTTLGVAHKESRYA
ncbi:EEIG family member 2-like [Salminus brasiliensis]|uniref:EEIG family member 2-like n=1 Tax=Salminus brasiliensis TaxID=930266 RepID=UPI003B837972